MSNKNCGGVNPSQFFIEAGYILFGDIGFGCGLEPAVEPSEEETLPHHGVLRFENPVVFVGVDYHFSRDAAELGGVECHHALRCEDTVVEFAVRNHDGRGPFVDEAVG